MAGPMLAALPADIIDVEFETVRPSAAPLSAKRATLPVAPVVPGDGLGILRSDNHADAENEHPNGLTPSFLIFTAIAAFVVFWVSGGHALLY